MSTVKALRERGHDALHLREEGLHRLSDEEILEKARLEDRVLLTFDLDFGDLLAAGLHESPSAILFRLHNQTPSIVTERLFRLLAESGRYLTGNALIVVEETRYRVRRLPILELEGDR